MKLSDWIYQIVVTVARFVCESWNVIDMYECVLHREGANKR